jgi:death-on-curing protein
MATKTKFIAIGNSAGVILPKEVLARLNVAKGDALYITESSQGIRLLPLDQDFATQMDAAREAMREEALMLHGGPEGVRDLGLLESALARPRNLFGYAESRASLPRLAAAYARGIVANQPFVDGNMRTAFTASVTFLQLNGLKLTVAKEDRVLTFWKLAAGEISEAELALWFAEHTAAR